MQTPAAPNFNLWCTCSIQKPHYVWEHDADCKRPNCMTKKPHKLTECIDYRESQYGRGVAPQRSDNNTQCKSCDNSKPHKNFDHAPCKCGYHQQIDCEEEGPKYDADVKKYNEKCTKWNKFNAKLAPGYTGDDD